MSCELNMAQSCFDCATANGGRCRMSIFELNDVIQRACPDGHWIYWGMGDTAYVANSHASTELGTSDEPLEELLSRLPDMCDLVDALKADKMERRGY